MARPTKLTDDVRDDLVVLLAAGARPDLAARAVGVSPRTVRRWLRRGDLRERVEQARAFGRVSTDAITEARLAVLIVKAAQSDWRAAAWWLERAHPEHWSIDSEGIEAEMLST